MARFRQRLCFSVNALLYQTLLCSLLQIASQHLDYQVPLVIRYQILQEFAVQLQREMLLILQENMYTTFFLQEDCNTKSERADLQSRLNRLIEARAYLVEF